MGRFVSGSPAPDTSERFPHLVESDTDGLRHGPSHPSGYIPLVAVDRVIDKPAERSGSVCVTFASRSQRLQDAFDKNVLHRLSSPSPLADIRFTQ